MLTSPPDLKPHENTWMGFMEMPNPGKKTRKICVMNLSRSISIADILWFPMWRQYCFFPRPETVFNADCLTDIAAAVKTLNDGHRSKA